MADTLKPKDHAETVALFRATVLGPLLCRVLAHGQLADQLRHLSKQPVRPPGSLVRWSALNIYHGAETILSEHEGRLDLAGSEPGTAILLLF